MAENFNVLVDHVSRDKEWLTSTLSASGAADEFTGRLLKIYKQVMQEGIKQPLTLGIFRSDYMFHSDGKVNPSTSSPPPSNTTDNSTFASYDVVPIVYHSLTS